jgi:hypothetical protein
MLGRKAVAQAAASAISGRRGSSSGLGRKEMGGLQLAVRDGFEEVTVVVMR